MKGLDYLAVRFRRSDEEIKRWTGARNVPVVLFDDEPPRTGWAEDRHPRRTSRRANVARSRRRPPSRENVRALTRDPRRGGPRMERAPLAHARQPRPRDGRAGWPKPVAEYSGARATATRPTAVPAARARAVGTLRLLDGVLAESRGPRRRLLPRAEPDALDLHAARHAGDDLAAARGSNAPCRLPFATPSRRSIKSEGGRVAGAARTPRADVQPAPGAAGPMRELGSRVDRAIAAATSASSNPGGR